MDSPIRVLLVDDSVFICYLLAGHLEEDGDIKVVGKAHNGLEALAKIPALKPDVVILDVEMPRMDGLTALKQIMVECPTPVIMFSVLTKRSARATIQALMRGAVDFVCKPDSQTYLYTVVDELKAKIKAVTNSSLEKLPLLEAATTTTPVKSGPQRLQRDDPLIVIGASTGGPRALQQILSELPLHLPAAVVAVQHMPAGFTRSLAQRLHETCALRVQEAAPGDRLARGLALLAPGDFHLYFTKTSQIRLDQSPRRNGVRPSIDVTMESAAQHYESSVIGVILTGMGNDGTEGARAIKAAGGQVIAEDESSSVIYGMPRSVVEAGWADQVMPLSKIAHTIVRLVKNE